jgi:hypothetical protein
MNANFMAKQTILFLTHIYPRYDRDFIAPFLGTLAENLTQEYNIIVLCPRHPQAVQERNGVQFEYFKYSIGRWEKLSYSGNLFAKVRGFRIHYQFLAICFLASFLIKGFFVARRRKADIIHSHWFIPAGIIGHIISLMTGIPHVVTVYSDSFLIKTNGALRRLARIIFHRAKVVIAISHGVKEYVTPVCNNVKVVYPCSRVF